MSYPSCFGPSLSSSHSSANSALSFRALRPAIPRRNSTSSLIRRASISKVMATIPDTGLYPLHRCKILHLVRHGQGYHNVEGEKDFNAYMSTEFLDASLTPLGWEQVRNLRKHIGNNGIASRIELVVTSPLMRTMQTAVGVFGGGGYIDGDSSPPLMVAGAGKSSQDAISSSNCPPFVAVEWCREHLGVHPCDKRKSITEYLPLFPAIDFSLVETDEDVLWKPDVREKIEEIVARGRSFFNWAFLIEFADMIGCKDHAVDSLAYFVDEKVDSQQRSWF